jgi:hypothetical protein
MKQTKDTNIVDEINKDFNPEYFTYYFDKVRKEAREKNIDVSEQRKIEISVLDRAIEHYSKKLNMSKKTARAALEEIVFLTPEPLEMEKNVKNLLFAIRQMAPKIHGLEQREQDTLQVFKQMKTMQVNIANCGERISVLESKMRIQEDVFTQSIQVMLNNTPTLWTVIKCTLKSFLSFLKIK